MPKHYTIVPEFDYSIHSLENLCEEDYGHCEFESCEKGFENLLLVLGDYGCRLVGLCRRLLGKFLSVVMLVAIIVLIIVFLILDVIFQDLNFRRPT